VPVHHAFPRHASDPLRVRQSGLRIIHGGAVDPARRLVGASESHAWVEAFLPGGFWLPLDPTNNCLAGERHVKVSVGRDYHDNTPTRNVFKGTHTRPLSVVVVMRRLD
jgi:transglutaminase-like putative cysteine protease